MSTFRTIIASTCAASLLLAAGSAFCDSMPDTRSDKNEGRQSEPPGKRKAPDGGKMADSKASSSRSVGTPPPDPKPQEIAPIFEERGVLTPRGTLTLEPSFQYINSSSNRVALSGYTILPALNIGLIDVRNVNSNTYVTALAARYGVTSRLEFEVKVPYVYRSDTTTTQPADPNQPATPGSVFTAEGNGIGDVEFGPRYQLNQPDSSEGPYFIVGVRAKSNTGKDPFEVPTVSNVEAAGGGQLYSELPTGSGFWALQPNLTVLATSDPVVFFGTLSYMWNMERNINNQGKIDPGDTIGFNVGIGFGLNEKVSMSLGYDHVVLGKSKRDGIDMPGTMVTQVATLLLGCSYRVNETTSISFSLGAGLTAAASNVQLTLRIPVNILLGGK